MAKKEKHVTEYDPGTLRSSQQQKSVDDIEDPAEKMRAIVQGMITPSKSKEEDDSQFRTQSAYEYLKFGGLSDQTRLMRVLEAAVLAFQKEAEETKTAGAVSAALEKGVEKANTHLADKAQALGKGIGNAVKMTGRGLGKMTGGVLRGAGRMSLGLAKKNPLNTALGALMIPDFVSKVQRGQAEGLQPRNALRRMVGE